MIYGNKQQTFNDYDGFVEKFKAKKTTDDCYTPPEIYEAVKDWAVAEYGLQGRQIIRPFYPNADYTLIDYPENCVVIDNPPFSIETAIVKNFTLWNIDYFLFAPLLTLFSIRGSRYLINSESIIYENGASIPTGFISNLEPSLIRTVPKISEGIRKIQKNNKARLPIYEYPDNLLTVNDLNKICKAGIDYQINDGFRVSMLDAQRAYNKAVFGGAI